jgi:hypothetical protein
MTPSFSVADAHLFRRAMPVGVTFLYATWVHLTVFSELSGGGGTNHTYDVAGLNFGSITARAPHAGEA